jgi:hypothetical protein
VQRHGPCGAKAAIPLRAAGLLLLVVHLTVVAWLTLRPLDVPWQAAANQSLFAGIRADLALGWPGAACSIGGGLALLAPLGVLLPMAGGRIHASPLSSLLRTVTAGALISLAIELLQTSVPGQVSDVDSLLLNTVGVALLHVAVVPAARARLCRRHRRWMTRRRDLAREVWEAGSRTDAEHGVQGRTPRISRVGIAP